MSSISNLSRNINVIWTDKQRSLALFLSSFDLRFARCSAVRAAAFLKSVL